MERQIDPRQNDREPTPEIVERAAEWLAHLESGDADDSDWTSFDAWRNEHPTHAVATERLGGLGARLRDGNEAERETLRHLFLRPRRHTGGALLGLVLLVGAGWFAASLPAVQLHFADERTAIGETRTVSLADGSRIVLASNSAIDVNESNRSVRLLRGELLAEVARRGPVRFAVETRDGAAEALGTAYTVRKEADATVVTVISSHVRACPHKGRDSTCLTLAPGERALLRGGRVSRIDAVATADAAAWAEGWLPVDNRPVSDVLAEFNRWRSSPIRFDPAALSGLRVSGIFPLRDTDQALANLARSLPVEIDRSDPASPAVLRRSK